MSDETRAERAAELSAQLESAEKMLANSTKAYRRVRQMRGANAHERSWHFKDQMDKTQARIENIKSELAEVQVEAGGGL